MILGCTEVQTQSPKVRKQLVRRVTVPRPFGSDVNESSKIVSFERLGLSSGITNADAVDARSARIRKPCALMGPIGRESLALPNQF